ncbi:YhdP family protein [Ramlibacter sp. PS4R-6]|uniref:YhdP family protein n=1 Tax=Ramlibacter sp. PS4R-6 TaxID=3133438 RepID=UPI0030A7EDEE
MYARLPPLPSRRLQALAALAKGVLWLLLAAWLVLALAWGALHAFIVPRIGELRPELEMRASRALGIEVRIGRIEAVTEGLMPTFELSDVLLLDPSGRPALRLPRVLGAVSPRSLLNLGFEQLYIDRPELDIRRDRTGRIFVAGLDVSRRPDDDAGAADWFFSQAEFFIRGGTVRWTDELRRAQPLQLSNVEFVMRNGGRRHAIRIDATPPREWGDRFSLRGIFREPLLAHGGARWQDWQGQVHGDFARVDVSQLRRYSNLGIEVSAGHGAVRAWADVANGQVVGGTADVELADVNTRLAPKLPPLQLTSVSGRIGGQRLATGFEFETQQLQFATPDGVRWPGGNVFVSWTDAEGSQPPRGEIRADKLDLNALGQVATRLPLGPATHRALQEFAPKGMVDALHAKWQGPLDALQSYEGRGRASALEIAARPAQAASGTQPARGSTPGVRGATIDFELTQAGGKGKLEVRRGSLDLPGVFEEPMVTLDELATDVQWKLDGNAISVSLNNLKFTNADANGEGQVRWRTADGAQRFPGVLDLQASLARADGSRVWRYLPLGVPKSARDYVRESVVSAVAANAKFRVKGNLADFPFRNAKQGEFRVTADVQNATYAFVPRSLTKGGPAWPALTQLSGELLFERQGMQVKNAKGLLTGAPTLQVKADAQIPDLDQTVVAVGAEFHGPLGEALAIVNGSPVNDYLNQALAKATGSGNADVKLKLEVPLAAVDKSKVQGTVVLPGNDIQVTPETPLLARSRGSVTFSDKGFAINGATARSLGGDVKIEGGTRPAAPRSPDTVIVIRAQGTATAEGLRQARELGAVARLARDASGGTPYAVNVMFRRGHPEVTVTSSLQGLGLNLPAPLNKAPDAVLPLRYENALTREALALPHEAQAGRLQDQLTFEAGRLVSVNLLRDVSGPETRVLRGTIGVGLAAGEGVAMPEQGIAANINLASVNLDQWDELLAPPARAAAAAAPGASAAPGSYLPTIMAVRAKELVAQGRTLHNVVVGATRDGATWRLNLDANELNGFAEYRPSSAAAGGRLFARLTRLSLGASATKEVESLLDDQPTALPALDVVVDDFELRGKKLGRLEIEAANRAQGAREWRLNKLNLTMPEANFSATGNWAALNAQAVPGPARAAGARTPERMRTAMRFRLDIADSGQLLARFGMKDVMRRGKGKMEGQVAWIGSPLAFNYGSMDGAFNVGIEAGQFLKADPGLAKLLGVLSLQSLPRRLALDFRDVFTEGFAFDFIRGDVTIRDGIAATNNLQMKGLNAAVLMEGRADIQKETQDLKVVVVPEINAGTASLVAAAINPAIGLGTFLAQLVLRQPLIRANTQEFHIDGTWTDPRVNRVGKKGEAQADAPKPPNTN